MHTILFFDDWFLDSHVGLVRDWHRPTPIGTPYSDPFSDSGAGYPHVEYDPDSRTWRAWVLVAPPAEGTYHPDPPDIGNRVIALWVSDDGLDWHPWEGQGQGAQDGPWPHVVFAGAVEGCGQIFRDPVETDPQRRYKAASVIWAGRDPQGKGHLGQRYELHLITSPDGIRWQVEDVIHRLSSDTYHGFTYNPHRQQYQVTLRANTPDRRIWMALSDDARTWSRPLLVLTPDPADPPCVQFYGMPHFQYHGYTVGLLWLFHTQYGEPDPVKRQGTVDTHLAYSLNGLAWNRTPRVPFLPLDEPGGPGAGLVYGSSIVETPEGDLRIYAIASQRQHGQREGPRTKSALAAYGLRKDGFVSLRPEGRSGQLITRAVVTTGEPPILNVRTPSGRAKVEVLTASEEPMSRFCGEDAAVFTGDATKWQVRWPSADFEQLRGRRIKLRVTLDIGDLYAIRFKGYFAYSHTAVNSLDGTELGPTLLPTDGSEVFL
jgi:hypothetical protein